MVRVCCPDGQHQFPSFSPIQENLTIWALPDIIMNLLIHFRPIIMPLCCSKDLRHPEMSGQSWAVKFSNDCLRQALGYDHLVVVRCHPLPVLPTCTVQDSVFQQVTMACFHCQAFTILIVRQDISLEICTDVLTVLVRCLFSADYGTRYDWSTWRTRHLVCGGIIMVDQKYVHISQFCFRCFQHGQFWGTILPNHRWSG